MFTSDDRALTLSTELLAPKSSRATQGVSVVSLKKKARVISAKRLEDSGIKNISRYRVKSIPAAGAALKDEDAGQEQLTIE